MTLSREDKEYIIRELEIELHARLDGGRKNLIVPRCPFCGKEGGKCGVYVGQEKNGKTFGMVNCFSCRKSIKDLNIFLQYIGRPDLIVKETVSFEKLDIPDFFKLGKDDEIDDDLVVVDLPESYKRCYRNNYLKSRGFTSDDYDYFQVGTTRGLNFKFDDYVIFPIIDNGDVVGYVSRHTWSKDEIEAYNLKAKRNGRYQIRRYNNSTENDFVKLLYNYDAIIEDETDTVIIVEGIFDVIALTRQLDLYENHRVACVATFGKKISDAQIYKLQSRGVRDVILGYDADATDAIIAASQKLNDYFRVAVARLDMADGKDWDEMDAWAIYDVFSEGLQTPVEFKLSTIDNGKIK